MEPTYKVSTVLNKPFVMAKDGGGYQGFIVEMLDLLAEKAGFSYVLQPSKDGQYGSINTTTGQWSGVIGEVTRMEADIGAADLTISSTRERYVDFTKPFLSQSLRLLVKKPRAFETSLFGLLAPLSHEIWFCIVLSMIIVAILFMLIGRFSPYEWRQVPADKDPRGARHSFGLRESLMFVFSTVTLQGYRETPKSLSGRVLAVFWFIFIILILVAYIAGVVAFNIAGFGRNSIQRLPFDGLDDLSRQTDIRVGMVEGGSTFRKLNASKIEVYQKIATVAMKQMPSDFVKTYDEGARRVSDSNGRYVMLMDSLNAEFYEAQAPRCDLVVYGESHFSMGMGLVTSKGSFLSEKINAAILSLREDGTLQELRKKWWERNRICSNKENLQPGGKSERLGRTSAMSLRSMAGPFIILLIGAIISVLLLIAEIVIKKFRQ